MGEQESKSVQGSAHLVPAVLRGKILKNLQTAGLSFPVSGNFASTHEI